ncbi:hypothetical protein B0A48_15371 [Cryoendolithus antarcticus]|uniref:Uncharacterized protein n=1 Tax=Cryoendolithus antarcticus TaxID=1507870 RepID=A0A1V8SHT0_9PEZI|nr:hypothetical protein B0A48_15371 [Cryoendolithus antarcticus]
MAANNPYKELLKQLGELTKGKNYEKELIKAVQGREEGIKMLKMQAENEIRRLQGVIGEMGKKIESQTSKTVSVGRPSKSGIAPALRAVPTFGAVHQLQEVQTAAVTERPTVVDSDMRGATSKQTPAVKQAIAPPAEQTKLWKRDLIEITDDDEEMPMNKSEKPNPPAKRKNPSTTPVLPRGSNKRSHLEADLADLSLATDTSLLQLTVEVPAKRQRKSKLASLATTESFDFKLVQSYSPGPTKRKHIIDYFDSSAYASTDSKANLSELTRAIDRLNTDVWERGNEEPWQFEFQRKTMRDRMRLCVTAVRSKPARSTKWRNGDHGEFACTHCAGHGLPCFTWAKEEREFRLLPLHEQDRAKQVEKGFEIRYWVNERD